MTTLGTSLRHFARNRPAWRPGAWTYSLVIGWLALWAALVLVAVYMPAYDPVVEMAVMPVI